MSSVAAASTKHMCASWKTTFLLNATGNSKEVCTESTECIAPHVYMYEKKNCLFEKNYMLVCMCIKKISKRMCKKISNNNETQTCLSASSSTISIAVMTSCSNRFVFTPTRAVVKHVNGATYSHTSLKSSYIHIYHEYAADLLHFPFSQFQFFMPQSRSMHLHAHMCIHT